MNEMKTLQTITKKVKISHCPSKKVVTQSAKEVKNAVEG